MTRSNFIFELGKRKILMICINNIEHIEIQMTSQQEIS